MKIRWTKQYDTYSCGPVALMNVLKWRGFTINYRKEIDWFRSITNCKVDGILQGTEIKDMNKALKEFQGFLKVSSDKEPTIKKITDHLEKHGIIVVFSVPPTSEYAHFFIIYKSDKGHRNFTVINCRENETMSKIKRDYLINLMRRRKEVSPFVWFISSTKKEIPKK